MGFGCYGNAEESGGRQVLRCARGPRNRASKKNSAGGTREEAVKTLLGNTSYSRNDREHQGRGVVFVVIDGVGGGQHFCGGCLVFAGVEVAVEARKIAAGNFHAQAVAGEKDVAGGPEVYCDVVYFARLSQLRPLDRIAIAQAENAFGQVLRESVGPEIHKLRGEIGVFRGSAGEEIERDGSGDFGVLSEEIGRASCRERV